MKNRRSFEEFEKELYIKESYNSSPNSFVLPSSKFLNKTIQVDEKSSILSWNEAEIIHGKDSSASKSKALRERLLGSLDVLKNQIESYEEAAFNVHKSYINSYISLEANFKKLENDANRNILLSLKKDPFSYGFTESFLTLENVDLEKSDIEVTQGKVCLGSESFSQKPLVVKSIRRKIYSKNDSIKNITQLSSEENVIYKDGNYFKVKVETQKSNSVVELELKIELTEPTNIDKLCVISKNINKNTKESIRVFTSESDSNYSLVDFVSVDSQGNIFEVNKSKIKYIKVSIQKYGADQSTNLINEYLFNIDYIGLINQTYKKQSTLYLKPIEIKDEDENPIDFNLATLHIGTCCIEPDDSSVSFYISKDDETYYPAPYFEDSNAVVEFKNVVNRNYFSKVEDSTKEYVLREDGSYILNNYLPANLNVNLDKIKLRKGINSWGINDTHYFTNIEIKEVEGRYFNLGPSSCLINNAERSGLIFLSKGIYEIKVSKNNYKEIKQNILTLNELKKEDELYPYNHKYIFEGYNYPIGYSGEKIYSGINSFWKETLNRVNSEILLDENTYLILNNENGIYFKVTNPAGEDFYINYELAEESINNKLYIKAILKSDNIYKTPRIDTIQARVI